MNDPQILELIKGALAEVAPKRTEDFQDLRMEQTIAELSLDSVTTMEMVGVLEEKTDKTFPDEDLARVQAIKDLAALVRGERLG